MGDFFNLMAQYLSPARIIEVVATALLYPVLIIEVASLFWIVYDAGAYTIERWNRRKARKTLDVEQTAKDLGAATTPDSVYVVLSRFAYGPVLTPTVAALTADGVTKLRALKLISDAEQAAARRLDRTRVFIRVGPILGLMGTLIPISPALVALASGDVKTLSTNLIVAFSTTVVGMLIGVIAYVVSIGRERMYTQDLSDLEYVLERAGA